MGMTYEQFWDGDCDIAPMFREAYKLRLESENRSAWLHGMYVYEALCDVAPVLRAFSKANKPNEYSKEPYEIYDFNADKREEARQNAEMNKAKASMEMFMTAFNKRFEKPKAAEVIDDGGQRKNTRD